MFEQVRVQGNGYRIALLTMIKLSQKMRTTGTNASAQNGRGGRKIEIVDPRGYSDATCLNSY